MLVPPSSATWRLSGGFEPDTLEDLASRRMWIDPDTDPSGMRVYFDALALGSTGRLNPNAGALQSRILPPGDLSMVAWLGVWKDCNGDGYIGQAETALNEYRSELLLDNSICPPGSRWNHHKWVSEFIHIGPDSPATSAEFPRVLRDDAAQVWGDFGRPAIDDRYFCASNSLPRGTLDSTGGMLRYLDCSMSYHLVPMLNDADTALGGAGGWTFQDPNHPERDCDNPLNVPLDVYGDDPCHPNDAGTLDGDPNSPALVLWDCGNGLPTAPRGEVRDIEGSLWESIDRCDTVERWTFDGTDLFDRPSGPLESAYLGTTHAGNNPADGRRMSDFTFALRVGFGVGGPLIDFDPAQAEELGIAAAQRGPWEARESYAPPSNLGGTIRSETLGPAGAIYFTFYASVGAQTLQRAPTFPAPLESFYGSEACGDAEEGFHAGWDCDPTHWYNPQYGGRADATSPRVGAAYFMRDTDCYDGDLVDGSGAFVSLAAFAPEGSCPIAG